MKVRIVCYEDVNSWILGKFAFKMQKELQTLGIETDIAKTSDPKADVNHHIIYYDYDGKINSCDTMMITHIDAIQKLTLVKKQLQNAAMGICMSAETVQKLIASGIPSSKLCYINPAQDGIIKPRSTVIGITCQTHEDGRKKEHLLVDLCKQIKPEEFSFKIMGKGWTNIVKTLQAINFDVEYYDQFNYEKYIKLVPTFDYYLYYTFDEGSMGYLDALAAGVKTIVTPQGYHLDAKGGITYPNNGTLESLINIFNTIAQEKRKITAGVSQWTWSDYAKKHLEVWQYLLTKDKNTNDITSIYQDGLNSISKRTEINKSAINKLNLMIKLTFTPIAIYNFKRLWKARFSRVVKKVFSNIN